MAFANPYGVNILNIDDIASNVLSTGLQISKNSAISSQEFKYLLAPAHHGDQAMTVQKGINGALPRTGPDIPALLT